MAAPENPAAPEDILPNELEEQWMRYEYLKKNCPEEAHSNMCRAMNSEWRKPALRMWIEHNQDDSPPPPKKPRMDESREEEEDENSDESKSESDKFKSPEQESSDEFSISDASDSEETKPEEEKEKEKNPSDKEYDLKNVMEWFESFGMKELQQFKQQSLKCSDIPDLLFIRRNCPKLLSKADSFKLPFRKLKVTLDYWRIKIEIYNDPESEESSSKMEYWRFFSNCLIWYNDTVRKITHNDGHPVLAAEDFYALLRKQTLDELEFITAPYRQDGDHYPPNFTFYSKTALLMKKKECKKMKVKTLAATMCRSFFGDDIHLHFNMFWNRLKPEILENLKFQVWEDRKAVRFIERKMQKKQEMHKCGIPETGMKESDQWKSARNLCIQNSDFKVNWQECVNFRVIELTDMESEDVAVMLEVFSDCLLATPITIKVQQKLNLARIKKAVLDTVDGKWNEDNFSVIIATNIKKLEAIFHDYLIEVSMDVCNVTDIL